MRRLLLLVMAASVAAIFVPMASGHGGKSEPPCTPADDAGIIGAYGYNSDSVEIQWKGKPKPKPKPCPTPDPEPGPTPQAPVEVHVDSRVYVCMKAPLPVDNGRFAAVTVKRANTTDTSSTDARFSLVLGNAEPAYWSASHGATCDNPATKYGEKPQGFRVGNWGDRVVDAVPYDWTKLGSIAPPLPFGCGINALYPYSA